MNLFSKTEQVRNLSSNIRTNFVKIGEILIEIRDKELFKEKYDSFTKYLESEDFNFDRSMAYKLIRVYEEFHDVERVPHLSLRTLISLVYVSDKETRSELVEEAKETFKIPQTRFALNEFQSKVERSNKRTDQDLEVSEDSLEFKCIRQLNDLIKDVQTAIELIKELKERKAKVEAFSSKFAVNSEINSLKLVLMEEWGTL